MNRKFCHVVSNYFSKEILGKFTSYLVLGVVMSVSKWEVLESQQTSEGNKIKRDGNESQN